ncbi:Hypothetical protein PHPALM_36995 [Phytophthora palmivora]|uniref:PiggyBac transposable element-derived protein domain-containing protein n=1 Tax=Phytophthora palmivora TaxID=4796 RepID=A0A2P4WYI1_9STRA|nr:Hypothetical protein PHPALM_36995 [Phytophthora palmivora]
MTPTDLIFDPALIDGVGGRDVVARGAGQASLLDDIRLNGWTVPQVKAPFPYMDEPYETRPDEWIRDDYPGIYGGDHGPTAGALNATSTALGAFLRFVTPQLLEKIAGECNDYFEENLDTRVEAEHTKQQARKQKRPDFQPQTPQQIKTNLQKTPEISGRDLCIFIGLLIARTIAPNKGKFAHHWKTSDEGAIPRGCFGNFMKRKHGCSRYYRPGWKLRPVIDALEVTFQRNFIPPPVMAFDDAVLPSTSPFNRMQTFMKDKPHRWGTKLFMLCCSEFAYCIRFEVYCGKHQNHEGSTPPDTKSVPAAVVRNLRQVFGPTGPSDFRLIVTDRFYTSVVLSMQLLALNFYSVGTAMTNKKGLCSAILPKKNKNVRKESNKRPAWVPRGTFHIAEMLQVPRIKFARWWDYQGVFVLATGGSTALDRTVRRDPTTGEQVVVMCPRFVKDYQTFMGGVDVHDQLRLQR